MKMRRFRSTSVFLRLAIATLIAIGLMSGEAQAATPTTVGSCNVSIEDNQPVVRWNQANFRGGYIPRYQIWRNGGIRAAVVSPRTTFRDQRVAFSTRYHYSVAAVNSDGASSRIYCGSVVTPSYSDIFGTPPAPEPAPAPAPAPEPAPAPAPAPQPNDDPIAPSSCSLSEILRKEVRVDWNGGSGDFFVVFRNGGFRARVDGANTFDDLRSEHGQNYTYTVQARTTDGRRSAQTSCGSIVTPPTGFSWNPPTAPASCTVSRNADGSFAINWSGNSSAAFYVVRRNGGWRARVDAPTTTFADSRLAAGTTYTYQVESRSGEGISARTTCGTVTA